MTRRLLRGFLTRSFGSLSLAVLLLVVSATVAVAQNAPVLGVVEHPTLGPILTDPDGWVLDTWAGE